MVLEVCERRLKTASNPVKMAVTVNALPQHVELTEPVYIVISDNSSPRPFIWQSLKDLTLSKFPDLDKNYWEPLLNG